MEVDHEKSNIVHENIDDTSNDRPTISDDQNIVCTDENDAPPREQCLSRDPIPPPWIVDFIIDPDSITEKRHSVLPSGTKQRTSFTNTSDVLHVASNSVSSTMSANLNPKPEEGTSDLAKNGRDHQNVEQFPIPSDNPILPSFKHQHQSVTFMSPGNTASNEALVQVNNDFDILATRISTLTTGINDLNQLNAINECTECCDHLSQSPQNGNRQITPGDAVDSTSLPIVEAELCSTVVRAGDYDTPLVHASIVEAKTTKYWRSKFFYVLCAAVFLLIVTVVAMVIRREADDSIQTNTSVVKDDDTTTQTLSPTAAFTAETFTTEPSSLEIVEQMDWFLIGERIEQSLLNQSRTFEGISTAMSKDGSTVIVGSAVSFSVVNASSSFESDVGSVCVYTFVKRRWYRIANVFETFPLDSTGKSVAIDGKGIIFAVGSPFLESADSEIQQGSTGTVRIYKLNTTSDEYKMIYLSKSVDTVGLQNQIGNDITGFGHGDEFGYSVDLSDDGQVVAIAARKGCYVQVFRLQQHDWQQLGQTLSCTEDSVYNNEKKRSIIVRLASGGSVLVVTGPSSVDTETTILDENLHVFRLNNTSWVRIGQPSESFVGVKMRLGSEVAISRDGSVIVACGSLNSSNTSVEENKMYNSCQTYQYNNQFERWKQFGEDFVDLNKHKGLSSSNITSVSINSMGNVLALGFVGYDPDLGMRHVTKVVKYNNSENVWQQFGPEIWEFNLVDPLEMCTSISEDGDTVAVGVVNILWRSVSVMETGISIKGGEVPFDFDISFNDNPPLDWSVERLDVEQYTPMYILPIQDYSALTQSRVPGVDYVGLVTDLSSDLLLPMDGVYRFAISTEYNTSGSISLRGRPIALIENDNTLDSDQFTFSTQDSTAERATEFLTLVIDFDERPYDIHWVLYATTQPFTDVRNNTNTEADGPSNNSINSNRTIIAFGPNRAYSLEQSFESYVEVLEVPVLYNTLYTFVMTDDGSDGLCCKHGRGSISMYNGTNTNSDNLLFTNTTENMKRYIHSFVLY